MRIVQSVLNLIITMLTARYLGPSNFGTINYAASIVAFFTPIVHLGFTSILVRELISEPKAEGEILGTSLLSCIGTALCGMVGMFAFTMVANHGETETIIVCILYSFVLLADALGLLTYWFQAHLLSKYTSIVSLIVYIIVSAYKVFLLITGKNVYWYAVSNVIDYALIGILQFVVYKHLGGSRLTFSHARFKDLFRKGKYYIISGLMIAVFAQTDRIMLKLMISAEATGLYSAAVACAGMTGFIFSAIIDSAAPSIFSSVKVSQEEFENNVRCLYSVIIYCALIQNVVITVFAKPIILIIYGKQYLAAVPALQVIVWYTTFSYIGVVRNRWLLAKERQYLIPRIDISGALANVVLNLILIPQFGIIGAAVASLVTQMLANVVMGWIIKGVRQNNKLMFQSLNPKYVVAMLRKLF